MRSLHRSALALGVLATVWGAGSRNAVGAEGKKPDKESARKGPRFSLVMLLSHARDLDAQTLAQLATRAIGSPISSDNPEATDSWCAGRVPVFAIRHQRIDMVVHVRAHPYFVDPGPEKLAESIADLRVRKALLEHKAYIVVSVAVVRDEGLMGEAKRRACRLVAELMDTNCLALYDPRGRGVVCCHDEIREQLRRKRPLKDLFVYPPAWVFGVDGNDPRMRAAVAEAKRRLPDFLKAFKDRKPKQYFEVKAPITDGKSTEFIWVEVDRIQKETIEGRLANKPVDLGKMREGTEVKVPLEDVCDWVYIGKEGLVGGFTIKVILELQKAQKR